MALPLATMAAKVGKKLLFDVLTDPEKVFKTIIIAIFIPLILFLLIFAAPIAAVTSLPTAFFYSDKSTQADLTAQTQLINNYKSITQHFYDQGMNWVKNQEKSLEPYDTLQETSSYDLSWMDLMSIDSIRYNQDFSRVTPDSIQNLAKQFIVKRAYKERYTVVEGKSTVTKTRAVILFTTVPFTQMLSTLGFSSSDTEIAENIDRTLIELVAFPASSMADIAYPLAYANVVSAALAGHSNISESLFLALITHESGGDWRAVNSNSNGTTDAGLCQINSSNWGKHGLANDPFSPSLNVAAGVAILSSDLQQYGDELDALYAYNAGTPTNGKQYNPSYAPDIEAIKAQLSGNSFYTAISYTQVPGHPIDLLAAESNGQAFYNPAFLNVTDNRTGEESTINRASGDGNAWASQAAVYPVNFSDLKKGDTLMITFPDGKSSNITISQDT